MKSPPASLPVTSPADASWFDRRLDRWLSWRDRMVASRSFQRWAARFPLTRPIARRRAGELFDLVAGFVYSQVLLACVRLHLFDVLADGPQTLAVLARRLSLDEAAAQRLLAAAVSLRLAERRSGERYGLGPLGAPMVGNTAIAAMVEHHAALYSDLRDPVALLKGQAQTSLAGYWPYAAGSAGGSAAEGFSPERVADYSALMSASQPLVADEVIDAYPLHRHACLLDVGGGEGTFLAAVAKRVPGLRLMLFDLPLVAERAGPALAAQGLSDRVQIRGGDFFADRLPQGADVVSLVRVIFDHSDERALAILRQVRQALPLGGRLLLAEPMAATPGAEAMGDAYFGFYLLAMGKGRPRSVAELRSLLAAAGFIDARQLQTSMPLQTQLIVATAGTAHPGMAPGKTQGRPL